MKCKFGILIDSYIVSLWQYNSIKAILDNENELTLIIINEEQNKYRVKINNILFFLFKALCVKIKQEKKRDIRELIGNIHTLTCKTEKEEKSKEYFKTDDLTKIKTHKLDFILKFGFGPIQGGVLNSARYGIWSFHHGDEAKYRGEAQGFWEIYSDDKNTCAVLEKLTDKLHERIVLKKGYFKTISHSFAKNRDQTLSLSAEWPSQLCLEIENKSFQLPLTDAQTNSKIHFLPSNSEMIVFVFKLLYNKIRNFYIRYLTFDFWHVGYINKNINEVLNTPIKNSDVSWMKQTSPSYFYADPFLSEKDGKPLLLLEYLPYKGFKGRIKAFSGPQFENEESDYSIVENYHLSYPNMFKDNGIVYCLPESFKANSLFIYEKMQTGWKKHLIIEDLKCIDPEIIFHEGYYYLFTTIKDCNHDTKLFIYYSKELLNGWQPHILNPVVSDVRSARGAGKIFIKENKLFRPGQNYSVHKEGSITISKINKISPTEYSEKIISFIDPIKDSKYSDKIHTINSYNNITVIDACRMRPLIFRPDILFQIIKSKI